MKDHRVTTYLYCEVPIDSWAGWSTLQAYMAPRNVNSSNQTVRAASYEVIEILEFLHFAQDAARLYGSTGETTEGPYISGLPFPDQGRSLPLIGWKENGSKDAFIVSPSYCPGWTHTGHTDPSPEAVSRHTVGFLYTPFPEWTETTSKVSVNFTFRPCQYKGFP